MLHTGSELILRVPTVLVDGSEGEIELAYAQISVRSAATVRDAKRNDNYPDIMASHLGVADQPEPQDPDSDAHASWAKRLGGHAYHECFLLIQEVKQNPSRSFRDTAYINARTFLLESAERDLFRYITLYFFIDKDAQSVVAVSAAGPEWRWAQFKRTEFPTTAVWIGGRDADHDYVEGGQEDVDRKENAFMAKFRKRDVFYLGRESSDKEWTKLRDTALIPILRSHPTVYPLPPKPSKSNERPTGGERDKPAGEQEERPKGKGRKKTAGRGRDESEGEKDGGTKGKGRKKAAARGGKQKQVVVAGENEAGPSQPTRRSSRNQQQK
ncbi:hypothetical protein OH76DRAFT_19936 [Lentinus brumalis]|uniref:Uncharacterized protein n=1 Tax=Lentinus brumalis TaxID=2498619 RepID=A0A371DXA0_9APHY|nr:hypothetical protein OH76DRAFT_19936 [Polyporus brumalis]